MGKDVKVQTKKDEPKAWLNEYFTADPNKDAVEEIKPTTHWNVHQHSFAENVRTYKETQTKLYESFKKHLSVLTNGAEDPFAYIQTGVNYFQESLDNDLGKGKMDFSDIPRIYNDLDKLFNPKKVELINNDTVLSNITMESKIEPRISTDHTEAKFEQLLNDGAISQEHFDEYSKLVKSLRTKGSNLGIDNDMLQIMSSIQPQISAFEDCIDQIINEINDKTADGFLSEEELENRKDEPKRDPLSDKNDPLYDALSYGRKLSRYIAGFVAGKSNYIPTDDDIYIYYKKLEKIIQDQPLYKGENNQKTNKEIDACYAACQQLAISFPKVCGERFKDTTQILKDRLLKEQDKQLNIVLNSDAVTQQNEIKAARASIKRISIREPLTHEDFDRVDFVDLFRDSGYRQAVLASAQTALNNLINAKDLTGFKYHILNLNSQPVRDNTAAQYKAVCNTIIACKMAELELDNFMKFAELYNHGASKAEMLSQGYNPDICKIFNISEPVDDRLKQQMEDYRQQLLNVPNFKKLVDFGKGTPDELFNERGAIVKVDKLKEHANEMLQFCMYSPDLFAMVEAPKKDDFIQSLSQNTINALTQNKGRKNSNSKDYNDIYVAMQDIVNAGVKPEGVKSDNYLKLFNVTEKYLGNHETRLSGENGQARVTACFETFFKLGCKLAQESPILRDEVTIKMRTQMLRDSNFRALAVENAKATITEVMGGKFDAMTYLGLSQEDKARVDIALGNAAFCKKAEAILKSEKHADRIKGKLFNDNETYAESVERMYEQYHDAFMYANEAVSNHFMTGDIKHDTPLVEDSNSAVSDMEARLESFEQNRKAYRIAAKEAAANNDDAAVLNCYSELLYMAIASEHKDFVNATEFNKYFDPDTRKANVEALRPFAAKMLTDMSEKAYQSFMENGKSEDLTPEVMIKQLKNMAKSSDKIRREYDSNLEKNGGNFKRKVNDPQVQKNM